MTRLREKLEKNKKRLEDIDRKIENLQKEKKALERKISFQELEVQKSTIVLSFLELGPTTGEETQSSEKSLLK